LQGIRKWWLESNFDSSAFLSDFTNCWWKQLCFGCPF
jgi:hypothetical protein